MIRRTGVLVAIIALASVTAQADIAVEFGRGAEKLTALDFSGDVSERQQVVIDFFDDDPRDLASFLCYEAELRGLENRVQRGVGIDCLGISPVISIPLVGPLGPEHGTPGGPVNGDALSPQIDAVTFFFFPGGHLVADGLTTVRPIFDGVGDGLDGGAGPFGAITHITGSIPGHASNIVDASGRFESLAGHARVRLSGAVNTESFFTEDGLPMAFSCYFTIMNGGRGHSGRGHSGRMR
jgi:hypothetical protein